MRRAARVKRVSHSPAKSRSPRFVVRPVVRNRFPYCLLMGLLHTTATDLPHLVHTHAKVMAMVAPEASAASARLRPVFELFATNRAYVGITFVWLPAADVAPAGPALAAPFFYTFAQGQLVYGDTLTTEQQVRVVLHALHAHA